MNVRKELYELIGNLAKETEVCSQGDNPFRRILDEVLFHADLRFGDYTQYQSAEGEFPVRLKKWIDNVSNDNGKKILFQLLDRILFIDNLQMQSLYRDAYRRIIVPWISQGNLSAEDMLSAAYESSVRSLLRQYQFFSITESFVFRNLIHDNSLHGLRDPIILGENKKVAKAALDTALSRSCKGLIGFEDFVGTGDQAFRILSLVRKKISSQWRVLFVPLIILERDLAALNKNLDSINIEIKPVLVVPVLACLQEKSLPGEPPEFTQIRTLIDLTAKRVLLPLDRILDDPPQDPYGYKGSGATVVTCHNTPNNTLPLIHHRAPKWSPLFRRVHHSHSSKDGLR